MAKKGEKKTRTSQYEAILQDKGHKITECSVISFKFDSVVKSHLFHFDLMENNLEYLIYDGPTETVRITIPKGLNFDNIVDLASRYGGIFKVCHSYNDYE